MKKKSLVFFAMLLIVFCLKYNFGQTKENYPVPDYYGIYLIIDGKLCSETKVEKCSFKTVDVKTSEGLVKAFEFKESVKFLIHEESNGISYLTRFRPMVFVSKNKGETANVWTHITQIGNGTDKEIIDLVQPVEFLVKPIQQRAKILVPDYKFTSGLYRLDSDEDLLKFKFYFWTGSEAEAITLKCANRSPGFMADSYKVCKANENLQNKNTNKAESEVSGDLNSKTMQELSDIQKLLGDAGLDGNKEVFEKYLAVDYTYTVVGTNGAKKTTDRAKYLSGIKKNGAIKSYKCSSPKLSFEGNTAIIARPCEYVMKQLVTYTLQVFTTERFIKRDGEWKLVATEIRQIAIKS